MRPEQIRDAPKAPRRVQRRAVPDRREDGRARGAAARRATAGAAPARRRRALLQTVVGELPEPRADVRERDLCL